MSQVSATCLSPSGDIFNPTNPSLIFRHGVWSLYWRVGEETCFSDSRAKQCQEVEESMRQEWRRQDGDERWEQGEVPIRQGGQWVWATGEIGGGGEIPGMHFFKGNVTNWGTKQSVPADTKSRCIIPRNILRKGTQIQWKTGKIKYLKKPTAALPNRC